MTRSTSLCFYSVVRELLNTGSKIYAHAYLANKKMEYEIMFHKDNFNQFKFKCINNK